MKLVLRTIATFLAGADAAGIPVAVCGELADDPAGALVLVGLGVDELSADAGSLDGMPWPALVGPAICGAWPVDPD
jgi:phosphotransferase system enzyme I (PtsP)